MDLSIPLIAVLGLVGYNLNKQINSREYIKKREKVPDSDVPSCASVYECDTVAKGRGKEQKRLDKFYRDAEKIENTNGYTATYNKVRTLGHNKKVRFGNLNSNDDTKPATKQDKIQSGPMFKMDKYFIPGEELKDFLPKEKFTNISQLTGKTTDFSHTNQVPFFGSNVKGANTGGTLERYTGSDKLAKKEVTNVLNGKQNIYSQSAFTNDIDPNRFENNLSQTQNNVLSFDQYKVPPIPGQYVRQEHKNVDDLRTLNHPKTENKGRFNHGSSIASLHVNNIGKVDKVKIGRFYTNSKDRYFQTGNKSVRNSYVDNSREDFRKTRKVAAVESEYNLGPGRDYRAGSKIQLSENQEGFTSLANEKTTKTARSNEWLKSRGSIVPNFDGEGISGTIHVPGQERETTNRFELNNAHDSQSGQRLRYMNDAKTTNKEMNIYEYKGTAKTTGSDKPESRQQYYNAQMKTKEHRGYTPGGSGDNFIGTDFTNISIKEKPVYTWTGPSKSNSLDILNASQIGSSRGVKPNIETDFSERYQLQRYPKYPIKK